MRQKDILIGKCKKTLCTFLRLLANMISVKRVIYSSKNLQVSLTLVLRNKPMEITNYQKLKDLFWEANRAFIEKDLDLLYEDISERCLCGALMH